MSRLIRRHWVSDVGMGLARRDRQSCDYEAYVPDTLAGRPLALSGPTTADVADAERALAVLDARASSLADTEAIARILLRAESVASSRIEGLEVGARRLLRAEAATELGAEDSDVTAAEVLGNIDAMATAIRRISPGEPITLDLLLDFHRRLLAGTRLDAHAGAIRTEQNWIGGSSYNPCSAAFIPPPAGVRSRPPRRPVPVLQRRRPACGGSGRHRARAVRDHPPLRRRQRPNWPRAYPARPAAARTGNSRPAAGLPGPGHLV